MHISACSGVMQIFVDIWRHKELHPQLLKLLSMWNGIFPQQLVDRMHHTVKQNSPAQMSGRQNIPPAYHSAQPAQHSSVWKPTAGAAPLQAIPAYHSSRDISIRGRAAYAAVQQTPYGASVAPVSVQYGASANNHLYPGPPGGHTQNWQQAAAGQPYSVRAVNQPSSQTTVLPDLLSSLLSSGLLSVQQPVSFASVPSAAPAVSYTHPQSRAGTPEAVNPEDCKFVPSRLKVLSCLPSVLMHACMFKAFYVMECMHAASDHCVLPHCELHCIVDSSWA